jgi:hypothetical protein
MRKLLPAIVLLVSTTTLAQLRGPTNQMLIAAAGSVPGANGTFFRSDISITNYRDADQLVSLQWLPQAANGTSVPARVITIAAHNGIGSEDFVASVMQQSGLGAIVITAVTSTGSIDPGGLLYATERIWSPQPDKPTGTVSQTFPVLATGALNAAPQVFILGQRIDSRYRTNVGVVNLDPTSERTFDIVQSYYIPIIGPSPVQSSVTVPPLSMQQMPLPNLATGNLQILVQPRAGINPRLWAAYGSSVDNVTGDSWSSLAFPLLTP